MASRSPQKSPTTPYSTSKASPTGAATPGAQRKISFDGTTSTTAVAAAAAVKGCPKMDGGEKCELMLYVFFSSFDLIMRVIVANSVSLIGKDKGLMALLMLEFLMKLATTARCVVCTREPSSRLQAVFS